MRPLGRLLLILTAAALLLPALLVFSGKLTRDDVQRLVPWELARHLYPSDRSMQTTVSPVGESYWIYDSGIVDANNDGLLDVFTTNHNWRQQLLLADGHGGYQDVLSSWGLDQNPGFPGLEISHGAPVFDREGLYIYWSDRHLHVRSEGLGAETPLRIRIQALTEIQITDITGFQTEDETREVLVDPYITRSALGFLARGDARLVLYPRSRGVPLNISVESDLPRENIYIGIQRSHPAQRSFSLTLQDRHAMAWSDFNYDGQSDIFITRGAIGGTLGIYPPEVRALVNEEFFLSRGHINDHPLFENIIGNTGIAKNGCSARHANWVDFDGDGLLDIFINCEDVGHVAGEYPNKLYRRREDGRFEDLAAQAGLEITGHNVIDYEWFDADNDADPDLFTHEDDGFHLYRNTGGRFSDEFVYRGDFVRIDNPALKGASGAYWIFDGKLSVADYDRDGDLDVFSASKKGNALLINNQGRFQAADLSHSGLPGKSVSAAWVDYDNDGRMDLHSVPQGIFRQDTDGMFSPTNLLVQPDDVYMAAIINWFDMDNNGTRDVMIALNENQTLKRWWETGEKDTFLWRFPTYRNVNSDNHWLEISLTGRTGNPEAIGARVILTTPDGHQVQETGLNDGAFYSQGHYRLYFGLGEYTRANSLVIRWPGGTQQTRLENVAADQILEIEWVKTPEDS